MESKKATTVLSDIMQKLSSIGNSSAKKTEDTELSTEEVELSAEVKEEIAEVAVEATEVKEEEVSVELAEEAEEVVEEEVEEIVEDDLDEEKYVSREEFETAIAEIKAMVGELSLSYKEEKVEMSEQIETLSKEPSAEPINHSPEAEVETKKQNLYSKKRGMSTMDRVLNAMNY